MLHAAAKRTHSHITWHIALQKCPFASERAERSIRPLYFLECSFIVRNHSRKMHEEKLNEINSELVDADLVVAVITFDIEAIY